MSIFVVEVPYLRLSRAEVCCMTIRFACARVATVNSRSICQSSSHLNDRYWRKRTFRQDLSLARPGPSRHAIRMLTELYIEALLVDSALADEVWELWDQGLISDELAVWAW